MLTQPTNILINTTTAARKIRTPHDCIESIDYIKYKPTAHVLRNYRSQKKKFAVKGTPTEILLMHGTPPHNLNAIINDNFRIDNVPTEKRKRARYGRGVYFSEIPALTINYGTGILLCKVLLGNCERVPLNNEPTSTPLPEQYDSREVVNGDRRIMHVIRNTSQILPYCRIQLKPEAITTTD